MATPIFPRTQHTEDAEYAMRDLEVHGGLPPHLLQRVGALFVWCNRFERQAERTLWILRQEDVRGNVPSTAKFKATQIITELESSAATQRASMAEALRLTCATARDVLTYRNCIAHGELYSFGDDTRFISNLAPMGEIRRGANETALISERYLDTAIATAFTVYRSITLIGLEASGPSSGNLSNGVHAIETLKRVASAISALRSDPVLRFFHEMGNLGDCADDYD